MSRIPAVLTAAGIAALALLSACGGKSASEEDILGAYKQSELDPAKHNVVLGYNEPAKFERGVGLRAAGSGRYVVISVRNSTDQPLTLGPKCFRLVLPDGLRAFEEGKDDLKGFPVVDVPPGEMAMFSAGISGMDDVANLGVVLNYPPAGVVMQAFVEPVQSN